MLRLHQQQQNPWRDEMITFEIVKNEKYGDYRISELLSGEWVNEYDNNWTKSEAESVLKSFKKSYFLESDLNTQGSH